MGRWRVLIVDYDPIFRFGLKSILEQDPEFEVVDYADNMAETLGRIRDLSPDIVIMDVFMQGQDEGEAISTLNKEFPGIKAVILTDSYSDQAFLRTLLCGARGYFLKSIEPTGLVDSVRLVARGTDLICAYRAAKTTSKAASATAEKNSHSNLLSQREKEILRMVAGGANNRQIAVKCCISETTVKAHLGKIWDKLSVRNRAQAVAVAIREGYLEPT
jgi:DNA-binding NarL/FixJ family response regulator